MRNNLENCDPEMLLSSIEEQIDQAGVAVEGIKMRFGENPLPGGLSFLLKEIRGLSYAGHIYYGLEMSREIEDYDDYFGGSVADNYTYLSDISSAANLPVIESIYNAAANLNLKDVAANTLAAAEDVSQELAKGVTPLLDEFQQAVVELTALLKQAPLSLDDEAQFEPQNIPTPKPGSPSVGFGA